ncbi:hypothetical protein [Abyssibacter sp.]|uniref:hypothetical protein n=1 Tax=Abyssibacter sp. TaxID=2320200 RepID=UPI0025BD8E10|nr:hypothetical protein [Abyssibacter sp.]MCK5859272.1 hypothetical protein [Abyssibacter sp.]
MSTTQTIMLARPHWTTDAWLAVLTLVLPLTIYWLAARATGLPLAGLILVATAGGSLFALGLSATRTCRAQIDGSTLRLVAGGLFRHHVPLSALQLDAVQIHYPPRNLGQVVGRRLKGVSLPGVHLGWFSMAYGRAFVVGPANTPVLEIRTGDGGILLAVANPQDALTRIRSALAGR